jgi:hypothetical protein
VQATIVFSFLKRLLSSNTIDEGGALAKCTCTSTMSSTLFEILKIPEKFCTSIVPCIVPCTRSSFSKFRTLIASCFVSLPVIGLTHGDS